MIVSIDVIDSFIVTAVLAFVTTKFFMTPFGKPCATTLGTF